MAYLGGGTLGDGASLSTIAASYSPSVSSGSLLVAVASWASGPTVSGVTDSQGNTWNVLTESKDTTNGQSLIIAYAMNAVAGATTVTFTLTAAAGDRRLVLAEYSGMATTSALDVQSVLAGANTTATDNVTSGAATTTVAGDLIVGGFMDTANGSNTQTAGTGFTKRLDTLLCFIEDKVQGSAGSVAATATFGTAGRYAGAMAAFKAAAGGSSVSKSVSDSVGINDTGNPIIIDTIDNTNDSAGVTDVVSVTKLVNRSASDSAGVTDVVSVTKVFNRTITDGIGIVDSVGQGAIISITINDGIGTTDSASKAIVLGEAVAGVGSVADQVMAALVAAGFTTGSIADRELMYLSSKTAVEATFADKATAVGKKPAPYLRDYS